MENPFCGITVKVYMNDQCIEEAGFPKGTNLRDVHRAIQAVHTLEWNRWRRENGYTSIKVRD